jgi:hypothetical protein
VFGDINKEVGNAFAKLDMIQQCISTDGCTETVLQENKAKIDLEKALVIEEAFWHEKFGVKWHCQGDRNTTFFHRTTKIKQAYKKITSLRVDNGVFTNPDLISSHAVNHFTTVFSSSNVTQDNGMVEEVIPKLITDSINTLLTLLRSVLEIKNVVFSMNKDGAPRPDGFGSFFFQIYWDIICEDFCNAVLEFFHSNWIMPNYNADTISQFRPIAMANFKFKIISKILADRLAQILPDIISKQQRGFIKGRKIKD